MKRLYLLIALLAVLGYAGWRTGYLHLPGPRKDAADTGQGAGGRRGGAGMPVVVTAADLKQQDVPVTLDAIGTVQALNTVTVRPQVDGKLIEVDFKEGQDVKAGDVLARIDPTTFQAQYDLAVAKKAQDEAQLANAKIDLARYTKLAQGNFGPKQQADTQRALVAQLDAQVRQDAATMANARAVLDYTTIRSPLDGRTGLRLVDPGNFVQSSNSSGLVVITQIKPMGVVFTLAQQNLRTVNAALAKGPLDAQALDSNNSSVIESGQVTVVDNQVDPTTGTVKIKAVFPNAGIVLWPGQFINIRLTVDVLKNAIVAPTAAVQRGPDGAYVYTLKDDGAVAQTPVVVGQQNEQLAVITSGLVPPARVATSGFARLRDGAKVRIVAPTPAPGVQAEAAQADGAKAPAVADTAAAPAAGDRPRGKRRNGGQGGGKPPASQ